MWFGWWSAALRALTLGPPLNLPLGGGGEWLAGEGTRCWLLGDFCDGGGLGGGRGGSRTAPTGWRREREGCCGWGCCGEFRASPCSLRSRPPSLCEGGGMACFVFRWIPASAGMTWGPGEWGGASGGGVGLVAPSGVATLCSAESCEGFGRVGDDSPFAFGGAVFGEGVGECVCFIGTLSAVTFDDFFGFQ